MTSKITRIWVDDGPPIELPVLFSDDGFPIAPLLRFQLANRTRALSWHRRLVLSVRLLLQYTQANGKHSENPQLLFEDFVSRLVVGTTTAGMDESGLHWLPRKPSDGRSICGKITEFSAHLSRTYGSTPLNPLREATWHERVCKFAAQMHRRDKGFLGHLLTAAAASVHSAYVHSSSGHMGRNPHVEQVVRPRFPAERFGDLILKGFAVKPNVADPWLRLNTRDVCITLLLHGGGLRCSEPFHMFINDVIPDPLDPSSALVRIGHPTWGKIEWRDADGKFITTTRAEYLVRHGLVRREIAPGPLHAGWKNPVLDGSYFLQVHWAEPAYGRLFLILWRHYQRQYLLLPHRPKHPWAWVSFARGHEGEPLKMDRFIAAHERAVRRIGLVPKREHGTVPHGHRHAYAQWLRSLGIRREFIRMFMHHYSLESQEAYKKPDIQEMHAALQSGLARLASASNPVMHREAAVNEAQLSHAEAAKRSAQKSVAQPLLEKWEAQIDSAG